MKNKKYGPKAAFSKGKEEMAKEQVNPYENFNPYVEMTTDRIFEGLGSQKFFDWYEKDFANFIQGDENAKSQEEILHDIQRIFNIG